MKLINFKCILLILVIILYGFKIAYSFDDGDTHPKITLRVADRTGFIDYLKYTLGFENGLDHELTTYWFPTSKTILKWLQKGSTDEDSPTCRAANHFHDPHPLKAWTDSYVTDSPAMIHAWCRDITPVWPQYSNITWATGYKSKAVKLTTPMDRQDMNWDNARSYFYSALTTPTPVNRDDYFVQTFRAVGQVLHLLEDMAVPAHVRNDFQSHLAFNGIRGNSVLAPLSWWGNAFEYYVKLNPGLIALAMPDVPAFPTPQVTDFWDTDSDGTVPGLAEFTNANYFSDETIPGNNPSLLHQYPMPQIPTIECEDTLPGATVMTTYRSRRACPTDGSKPDHFVALSLLNSEAEMQDSNTQKLYIFDKNVHKTYATDLLPKVIGYSAALLDYFFRGTLNVTSTDVTFRSVKVTVANGTPGEVMGTGKVALVLRYKELTESDNLGVRTLSNPTAEYSYRVGELQDVNLSNPAELTFDFSNDPLPLYFDDLSMQLVYSGPLGNESNSVAVSPIIPLDDGIHSDYLVTLPPSGVYAVASDTTPSATFNELRVTALTEIPGGLTGGHFELALEYRVANSDPLQAQPGTTEPINKYGYIFRKAEDSGISSLAQGVPAELVFNLSSAPLPVKATDVGISVIYIDSSTGKTKAIAYRDISEPTPIDLFNNSDFVCINNTWYQSGTPEARTAADLAGNNDGLYNDIDTYPHDFANVYFKLSSNYNQSEASSNNYNIFTPGPVHSPDLQRMGIVLTDQSFTLSLLLNWAHTQYPSDDWGPMQTAGLRPATAVRINTDEAGEFAALPMYNMRGKLMWGNAGTYLNRWLPAATCNLSELPPAP